MAPARPSGGSGLPITFTTAAPTTPGTYTYAAAWFGNRNNSGSTHAEVRAPAMTITVAAASVAGPMTVTPAGGLTSTGTAGRSVHPVEPVLHGYEHGHRPDELDGVEGADVGDLVGGRRNAGGGSEHDGDGVDRRRREQPGGRQATATR